jgi:hypothetical protein
MHAADVTAPRQAFCFSEGLVWNSLIALKPLSTEHQWLDKETKP